MQALPKVKQMRTKPKAKIDLYEVERYAATGASIEDICKVLGVSEATLYRHKKDSRELRAAFEKGRAKARTTYAAALGEIALLKKDGKYVYKTKHRLKAITFFLERQPGWQKEFTPETETPAVMPVIDVKIDIPEDFEQDSSNGS